ncbi:hypothetical protein RHMOL_Rhmol05G0185700 [Rhododendron molle]|uniref:Uncharacterized protein n=1 Tax=Rhododendron molle TaxID=49168 RepID=A0ACC0NQN7_RHOML|nr:hypothetical protein RHMOL_Rhmol05G0185700 [Rhododendron molle]
MAPRDIMVDLEKRKKKRQEEEKAKAAAKTGPLAEDPAAKTTQATGSKVPLPPSSASKRPHPPADQSKDDAAGKKQKTVDTVLAVQSEIEKALDSSKELGSMRPFLDRISRSTIESATPEEGRQQWKPQRLSDVIDKQQGMERSLIHRDRSSPSLRMGRSSNENGDGRPAKGHFHLKDQAPVAAATAVFLIGQGSFSDGMPLGISGIFNFMIVFQAEHNILMHPFHMLGVAGVLGGSLFSAMHGSLEMERSTDKLAAVLLEMSDSSLSSKFFLRQGINRIDPSDSSTDSILKHKPLWATYTTKRDKGKKKKTVKKQGDLYQTYGTRVIPVLDYLPTDFYTLNHAPSNQTHLQSTTSPFDADLPIDAPIQLVESDSSTYHRRRRFLLRRNANASIAAAASPPLPPSSTTPPHTKTTAATLCRSASHFGLSYAWA